MSFEHVLAAENTPHFVQARHAAIIRPRHAARPSETGGPGRFYPEDTSVPFAHPKLHPSLLKGIRELGFARTTPIQADAIPPALARRDVLACAMTGSGQT